MKSTINRAQIVSRIAKTLDASPSKVLEILLAADQELIAGAKKSGQVRLLEFGTFYLHLRKSRQILQVNSRTPRLLLEQNVLKFRPTPSFKDVIFGRAKKIRQPTEYKTEKSATASPTAGYKIAKVSTKTQAELPAGKSNFKFAPLKINSRVDREKIRAKINERLAKIAQKKHPEVVHTIRKPLKNSPHGTLFASIFKQLNRQQIDRFNLIFDPRAEECIVYILKPKKQVGKLPTKLVKKFIDEYLEMSTDTTPSGHHLGIPEERFVILAIDSKISDRIYINAHLMPTAAGASVYFNFKIK